MTATTSSDVTTLCPKVQGLLKNINGVLVGQEPAAQLTVVALLAGGHVILEDVPGVGKTLLAKSMANSIEAVFKRIQCTPDLLPSDVSGVSVYEQREGTFKFIPGPIFSNILLCDEINRATPRTQSSLLEAMEEGQVTTDGTTRKLPELFFVMATQNPIEQHGTFPLPEAQLDRFSISVSMGYPKPQEETTILKKTLQEGGFLVQPVLSLADVIEAKQAVKRVFMHDALLNYIVEIVNATRQHPAITLGVSPRGSQLIMRASQALAFIEGRDYVQPEDIKKVAPFTLGHRIIPKVKSNKISHAELIEKILDTISVPS